MVVGGSGRGRDGEGGGSGGGGHCGDCDSSCFGSGDNIQAFVHLLKFIFIPQLHPP